MKKIALILWVCLCLWLTPLHAFARAGGGGSSGSGGGGSSSHSTRHSSSARRMHPAASTIITISAFSLIALSKRYREIGPALKKHRQIKNQLPVDSHQLDDQVKEAYFALQNGWAQQNLEAMRPYLSPLLYTQWEGKLSWMKMRHEKNVLLDIELKHAISCRVEQDAVYYLIEGKMIDYTLNDTSQELIEGSYKPSRFIEYWKMVPQDGRYVLDEIWQQDEFHP